MMAAGTLLTHARGIETDVGTALSARIALPLPIARWPHRFSFVELLADTLAGSLGGSLDRRFTQSQSSHFLQHAIRPVGKAAEHARQRNDLLRCRRQRDRFSRKVRSQGL